MFMYSYCYVCSVLCILFVLFCVLFVCKCVLYCTVLLPPGVNRIAVNKYIISYHIVSYHIISYISSYHIISNTHCQCGCTWGRLWTEPKAKTEGTTSTVTNRPETPSVARLVSCRPGDRVPCSATLLTVWLPLRNIQTTTKRTPGGMKAGAWSLPLTSTQCWD